MSVTPGARDIKKVSVTNIEKNIVTGTLKNIASNTLKEGGGVAESPFLPPYTKSRIRARNEKG